jgi:hypothetical protein
LQFADRCKNLVKKVVCKVDDPVAQRVHNENAERLTLASFVTGLTGIPGRQVRYGNPQTLEQALQIALSVQEAERQEKFSDSFYAKFDRSVRLTSTPSGTYSEDEQPRRRRDSRTASGPRSRQNRTPSDAGKATTSGNRTSRTRDALRCFECQAFGHFASECPTRRKREANPSNPPGSRGPAERSKRPGSPSGKPPFKTQQNSRKETRNHGNEREA